MTVEKELKKLLWEAFSIKNFKKSSYLINDLNFDSLDIIELMCEVQERFSIVCNEEDYENIKTIEDLIEYIEIETKYRETIDKYF